LELWRSEVRAGRRDSAPLQPQAQTMLAQFDWEARSRVVEDGAGLVAGAVLVTSRESSEGTVARIDPAAADRGEAPSAMRDLIQWGLQLSRAAGAAAAQIWVGPGRRAACAGPGRRLRAARRDTRA
jgi:hypothetical protein